MYSVVLATVLTAGSAAPDHWLSFGCHGCHGCHGGCWGCSGCYGCRGACSGCYGSSCYGCGGGYYGGCGGSSGWGGCYGCYGSSSYGCFGGSYSGCSGGSCYGCFGGGCYGSSGGYYYGSGDYYGTPVVPGGSMTPAGPGGTPPVEDLAVPPKKTSGIKAPATIVVKAPADARLIVNGQPTPMKGTQQTFASPDLEPGRTYAYVFRVDAVQDGKPVSRTKRLIVEAGQRAAVDLNEGATDTARITVKMPADARLVVDGVTFTAKGGVGTFETPRLEPGRSYYYTLRAEGVRNGQAYTEDKRVVVEAGKEVNVEFAGPAAVRTAAR